jgi:anti-anti-sigma factor
MSDPLREPFIIDVTELSPGAYLVVISGEMDIATSPELTSRLATVRGPERYQVLVDLSQLTFMDSTGIKSLISSAKEVESRGGRLVVFAPTANVQRVFDIVHFADVVPIADSLDAAISQAQQSRHGTAGALEG